MSTDANQINNSDEQPFYSLSVPEVFIIFLITVFIKLGKTIKFFPEMCAFHTSQISGSLPTGYSEMLQNT